DSGIISAGASIEMLNGALPTHPIPYDQSWREWLFLGKILDAKALTSAMDTRVKHYQALREEMVDLKKA
ncbi:hypothetical protein CEY02_19440, partial [Bacillus pumilus]